MAGHPYHSYQNQADVPEYYSSSFRKKYSSALLPSRRGLEIESLVTSEAFFISERPSKFTTGLK